MKWRRTLCLPVPKQPLCCCTLTLGPDMASAPAAIVAVTECDDDDPVVEEGVVYTWYLDGAFLATMTTTTIVAVTAGTYTVSRASPCGGCELLFSNAVTVLPGQYGPYLFNVTSNDGRGVLTGTITVPAGAPSLSAPGIYYVETATAIGQLTMATGTMMAASGTLPQLAAGDVLPFDPTMRTAHVIAEGDPPLVLPATALGALGVLCGRGGATTAGGGGGASAPMYSTQGPNTPFIPAPTTYSLVPVGAVNWGLQVDAETPILAQNGNDNNGQAGGAGNTDDGYESKKGGDSDAGFPGSGAGCGILATNTLGVTLTTAGTSGGGGGGMQPLPDGVALPFPVLSINNGSGLRTQLALDGAAGTSSGAGGAGGTAAGNGGAGAGGAALGGVGGNYGGGAGGFVTGTGTVLGGKAAAIIYVFTPI